jgi:hypothetical protein
MFDFFPKRISMRAMPAGNRSTRRASVEVCEVVAQHACGNLSEARAGCGEESAEQATAFQRLEPGLPALSAADDAIEDFCRLGEPRVILPE